MLEHAILETRDVAIADLMIDFEMKVDVTAPQVIVDAAPEEPHYDALPERLARRSLDGRDLVRRQPHAATFSVAGARSFSHACIRSLTSRPSRTAQTTSEAPRTMSPAANTPGIEVCIVR